MERLEILKYSDVLIYLLVLASSVNPSEVPRPRGVSLSRAPLYTPDKDFLCFDGSLTIPFSQVNDDYCDCPDASDEPGTSACPHGIFHCTNAGHKPLNVASSRVNDGVCDCCDASDEYANEKVKCVNNCNELGRSAREEAQKKAELIKAGKQVRAELSERGNKLKQEKKEKLTDLEKTKIEALKVKEEKEKLKKQFEELENEALKFYRDLEEEEKRKREEAEASENQEAKPDNQEALETFSRFDSNGDGRIDLAEIKCRKTFDRDMNGEVTDEEAKYFLNQQESVDVEEFVTIPWSRIKPFLMLESKLFVPPKGDDDEHATGEEETGEHENGDDLEDGENEGEAEDVEEEVEETSEGTQAETKPQSDKYDEETQKRINEANEARKEHSDAERDVHNIESEIKTIEEYLDKDFGLDEEFATLEGECFEYFDYEYVYTLCPFDKATQKPRSGSSEMRLGVWSKWIGPESGLYDVMLYDRGQSCWNGPQRSTRVRVFCGSENKVTAVSEPNRCEYSFDFTTPAACRDDQADQSDDVHDEL